MKMLRRDAIPSATPKEQREGGCSSLSPNANAAFAAFAAFALGGS